MTPRPDQTAQGQTGSSYNLRTGANYRVQFKDRRLVIYDGEVVTGVATHPRPDPSAIPDFDA